MKPGRNDPCPCGSGKKYKHCHLVADEAPRPGDLAWRRVRRAVDDLAPAILKVALDHFGPFGIHEAWDEFWLFDDDNPFDPKHEQMGVFMPWFVYDWLPDPSNTETPDSTHSTTAADAYRQRLGRRVDPVVDRYIGACLAAKFSFHEVLRCDPGRGFRLRDVLTGTEADVLEQSASERARTADILFGKVVPIDGIFMLDACAPVAISPIHKPQIIELRQEATKRRTLTGNALLDAAQVEIREVYLSIAERVMHPTIPKMQNTDGDPLELRTLHFAIEDAQTAFDALKDLAGEGADAAFRGEVDRDDSGAVVAARFGWLRVADNTILAMIAIDGERLRVEVNSAERARRVEAVIVERLGPSVRALAQSIASVESALRAREAPDEKSAKHDAERDMAQQRLNALPEMQAAITAMLRKHYATWPDEKLPVLGNRTPRNAVKTADGREAVKALLAQFERDGARMEPPLAPSILADIKRELGVA